MSLKAVRLDVYLTAIPMLGFEHAAARRELAEAVVVRVVLSDGRAGVGETHPRPYVTGETIDSVLDDIKSILWPAVATADLTEKLPELPETDSAGRCMNAAACAVELALLDAMMDEQGWARLAGKSHAAGELEGKIAPRVSGVIGSASPSKTARTLRIMRLFGLRDFKLKLGFNAEIDKANLSAVVAQIGRSLANGKKTLRVDVNGGWTAQQTPRQVAELKAAGVCVVEQPTYCSAAELADLARCCELPLMADESLRTINDARQLLSASPQVWWNIRLSKNGGLRRCLALAEMASAGGVPFVIGCMVGESGILSAAQRRLLQLSPPPVFVEGNYGRFLLADDLVKRSPRFGYGGRLKPLGGRGLGIGVDDKKLSLYGRCVMKLTS